MVNHNKLLYLYLGITFGVTWGIGILYMFFGRFLVPITGDLTLTHPLIIIALCSPSIAGLITYYVWGGFEGIKGLLFKIIPRKKDLFWFPIMAVVIVFLWFAIRITSILVGLEVREVTMSFPEMITMGLFLFIQDTGLLGGLFGWIGFLLPFLQKKFKNNIISGLLTGFAFGLWVLPGYVISSFEIAQSYILYMLMLMAFIVFMSYIFNVTEGNLLIYTFTFWLVALGSNIELYYFIPSIQLMQFIYFTIAAIVIHFVFKKFEKKQDLQTFPDFIQVKAKPEVTTEQGTLASK